MMSGMSLLMNIVLGIVVAAIGSAIFSFFGIALGGWLGYLIALTIQISKLAPTKAQPAPDLKFSNVRGPITRAVYEDSAHSQGMRRGDSLWLHHRSGGARGTK